VEGCVNLRHFDDAFLEALVRVMQWSSFQCTLPALNFISRHLAFPSALPNGNAVKEPENLGINCPSSSDS
jgi:hypothetical protein